MPPWTTVLQLDPGWLYVILNQGLVKVGKTQNPAERLRQARTWLPEGRIVGVKPFWNVHSSERAVLSGLANYWAKGEWHKLPASLVNWLVRDFGLFHDHDRNRNSVDFGYWINSSGMAELIIEQNRRKTSLQRWQRTAATG